jgi:hypothetical protein
MFIYFALIDREWMVGVAGTTALCVRILARQQATAT